MPETGRAITQEDFDRAENVAVLGQTAVRNIFHGEEPIGSTIRIRNFPFKVIGVLEEKGYAPGGYDQDDIVLVPYKTARIKMLGTTKSSVEIIAAATYDREELPQAAQLMRDLLRFRHRLSLDAADDFTIRTQLEVEKFYQGANETLTMFLVVVAMISLLVGGVGIMNLLIDSVVSRTREIGVCLAVGAKRGQILMEFLIEAMMLSLVGGSMGILLGIAGAAAATMIAGWPTIISGNIIVVAFIFSLVVVAFSPVHYDQPSDRWKYQVVQSIRTLTLLRQAHPEKRDGDFHFRAPAELRKRFAEHSDLPAHSREIADRCDFTIALGDTGATTIDVDLRPQDIATVQTLSDRINRQAQAAGINVPVDFEAVLGDGPNGIVFRQNSTYTNPTTIAAQNSSPAAEQLGLLDGAYDPPRSSFRASDRILSGPFLPQAGEKRKSRIKTTERRISVNLTGILSYPPSWI